MQKRVLFVLGGLAVGGVETYVVRLAEELIKRDCQIHVIILSKKVDKHLLDELSRSASVTLIEWFPFLKASNWLNAFVPLVKRVAKNPFDVVHVVDMLTLGFVCLNRRLLRFQYLSIGIYHARELVWWRSRTVYFREKLIELYDRNVSLTLFPSETTAELAASLTGVAVTDLDIVPLGVKLAKYASCTPSATSTKIVSVGRLVNFKAYNRHMISQLAELRKLRRFEYFIYGEGPEESSLRKLAEKCGVAQYVHFMGKVDYDNLPNVLDGAFCFVGSGTTIIEASAAGVISVIGIESIQAPETSGLFSESVGYSYNESTASSTRIPLVDVFRRLHELDEKKYLELSDAHRWRAKDFDLENTATSFLRSSCCEPDFDVQFNRWLAILSFIGAILRFGPEALKRRFDSDC